MSMITEEYDEGLIAAMDALQTIKNMRPDNGKFKKLATLCAGSFFKSFIGFYLYIKTPGKSQTETKILQFWVRYLGLTWEVSGNCFYKIPKLRA